MYKYIPINGRDTIVLNRIFIPATGYIVNKAVPTLDDLIDVSLIREELTSLASTLQGIVQPPGSIPSNYVLSVSGFAAPGGGGSDANFVFTQVSALATWNITHNLGKFPSVTIVDSSNNQVFADVQHTDVNSLVIQFATPFAGKAILN
jgi:hypothetical protein